MNKRQSPQSNKEFLQALLDLFEKNEPVAPEEVASYLDDRGYDRKALVSDLRAKIEKAVTDSPLNWRNAVDDLQEQRLGSSRPANKQPRSRQDIIVAIRSIYSRHQISPVAHYRNLEKATDEDLLSLLEDLQELDNEQGE